MNKSNDLNLNFNCSVQFWMRWWSNMKYYSGEGFLNSAINNLPFEMLLPGGYNWCGPGTKVEKLLAWNDLGIKKLDEACKEHDIFYAKEKDLTRRHEADKVLGSKAMARLKASEKLAALGVAGVMKAKVKLGMGLSGKIFRIL